MKENKICLNMIVKNESKIIKRLLNNVLPIIDTFCICDTGSSDNTIDIIKQFSEQHNIEGKIIKKEFINFEYNRNYSLTEAKKMDCNYILLLDADMIIQIDKEFNKNLLDKETYMVKQNNSSISYYNLRLISKNSKAEYVGVTHEYINNFLESEQLNSITIIDINDGGSKHDKFIRDIKLLSNALLNDPLNIRYNFYLANSYFDIKDFENAIKYYKNHFTISNWDEEKFYNLYRQGLCYKQLNEIENMINSWIDAWILRPTRSESLYELLCYYKEQNKWNQCKIYYEIAKNIKFPVNDILFVHKDIYEHKLLYEYSLIAFYVNDKYLYNDYHILINNKYYDTDNLFCNYKFYYPTLDSINSIDITEEYNNNHNNYTISSSSIIKYKNKYTINITYSNYNHTNYHKNINKCLIFSDNFTKINSKIINNIESNSEYSIGHENIKLINFDNTIYYTSIVSRSNNEWIGTTIQFGNYNNIKNENNKINFDNQQFIEKNWCFLPSCKKCIYSLYPITIYTIENNKLINKICLDTPPFFRNAICASNAYYYSKDNEIWLLIYFTHKYYNS